MFAGVIKGATSATSGPKPTYGKMGAKKFNGDARPLFPGKQAADYFKDSGASNWGAPKKKTNEEKRKTRGAFGNLNSQNRKKCRAMLKEYEELGTGCSHQEYLNLKKKEWAHRGGPPNSRPMNGRPPPVRDNRNYDRGYERDLMDFTSDDYLAMSNQFERGHGDRGFPQGGPKGRHSAQTMEQLRESSNAEPIGGYEMRGGKRSHDEMLGVSYPVKTHYHPEDDRYHRREPHYRVDDLYDADQKYYLEQERVAELHRRDREVEQRAYERYHDAKRREERDYLYAQAQKTHVQPYLPSKNDDPFGVVDPYTGRSLVTQQSETSGAKLHIGGLMDHQNSESEFKDSKTKPIIPLNTKEGHIINWSNAQSTFVYSPSANQLRVAVDFSFSSLVQEKERNSVLRAIKLGYDSNLKSTTPYQFMTLNLMGKSFEMMEDGETQVDLQPKNACENVIADMQEIVYINPNNVSKSH